MNEGIEERKKLALSGLYESIRALVRIGENDLDKVLEQVKLFWKQAEDLYGIRQGD